MQLRGATVAVVRVRLRRPHAHSRSVDAVVQHGQEDERGRLVWSVDETARRLGISRAHAYELIARGDLPSLRLGRRIVVPVRAIEALLG